jgi:hypothetical protein
MPESYIVAIFNFIICYFTCWLFFRKKLSFLDEISVDNYKRQSLLEEKLHILDIEILRMRENKKENELINGVFKNNKNPGEKAEFIFRLDPESEKVTYILEDGKTYSLPYYLIRNIRRNKFTFDEIK